MSVAFPSTRSDVPNLDFTGTVQNNRRDGIEDSRNASCAWSFCSGHDSELPSSQNEEAELLNLRVVQIKYGSQGIDSDSDTEEGGQPCEVSERAEKIVASVCATVSGLVMVAGCFLLAPRACDNASGHFSGDLGCATAVVLASVISSGFGVALSAAGVKNLVQAYKAGHNT